MEDAELFNHISTACQPDGRPQRRDSVVGQLANHQISDGAESNEKDQDTQVVCHDPVNDVGQEPNHKAGCGLGFRPRKDAVMRMEEWRVPVGQTVVEAVAGPPHREKTQEGNGRRFAARWNGGP